jgi:hypothetical protein
MLWNSCTRIVTERCCSMERRICRRSALSVPTGWALSSTTRRRKSGFTLVLIDGDVGRHGRCNLPPSHFPGGRTGCAQYSDKSVRPEICYSSSHRFELNTHALRRPSGRRPSICLSQSRGVACNVRTGGAEDRAAADEPNYARLPPPVRYRAAGALDAWEQRFVTGRH